MTAKKDVVVAIMSVLNALTFNRAALVLGGRHLLSIVLDELWFGLHTRDQDAPMY